MRTIIFAESLFASVLLLIATPLVFSQAGEQELPLPEVIDPAPGWNAPSDAVVLFDGSSLDKFKHVQDGSPVKWKISGDHVTVVPETGSIRTKENFGDCQLHVEWKTPVEDADKEGQKSGNSGVYLMGKYEVQVLNSHTNITYADGQAGAIYRQHPPLVNASRKPGEWQVFDIVFTAPVFNPDGSQKSPAYFTVFHNGVLIQNHVAVTGPGTTAYNKELPEKTSEGPLMLQDHRNRVSFRNIWIRPL